MTKLSYSGIMFIILSLILTPSILSWESDKLVDLNYFLISDAGFKDEEGEIGMSSGQAIAVLPIALGKSAFLAAGIDYQGLFVDYRNMDFSYEEEGKIYTVDNLPDDIHAIDLLLGLNFDLGESASVYAEFRPGLHSDMIDISEEDLYYQGGVILSRVFGDSLILSLGCYYSDEFGEPRLFPLGGVQWQIGDSLVLDTLLPTYLVFSVKAAPGFTLGFRGRLQGHQFRLSKELPWKDAVLKYTQIMYGPFIDLSFWDNFKLRLEGGIATAREFEFRDDDSSEKIYCGDVKDGGYINASLILQY